MKKCCDLSCIARRRWKKITRVMKLTLTLILFAVLAASADSSYSQSARINLKMQDASLVDVFREIERTSEFGFFFKSEEIDLNSRVTIDFQSVSIEKVLKEILTDNYDYRILDKNIIVTRGNLSTSAVQQGKLVSGKVTDSSGASLPGVSVVVKRTTNGTITDGNGNYSLSNVPENATIQFSFVGMKMQEVPVAGKTTVNVTMAEDAIGIEEVVAIGYGTMKKSDLTGAVVSVTGDKLRTTATPNFDQALQGKAAGVQVSVNSGQPGAATTIRIRGTNSLLGTNEPLYVIDGIQIGGGNEGVVFTGNGGNTTAMRTSPLTNLNPNDIESIEILKDASAAAIYGNRGANGVVLITTKKGKKGDARIAYDYSIGFKNVARKVDVMGLQDYAAYTNELASVQARTPRPDFANPSSLGKGTDWQDEIFGTGQLQTHNLSLTGGNDQTTYFVSAGYTDDNGPVLNSSMERYTLRANLESKIRNWATFGNNFSFGQSSTKYIMSDATDAPLFLSLTKGPDVPVRDANGNFLGVNPGGEVPGGGLAQANPVSLTNDRDSRKKKFDIYNNLFVDLHVKDFSLRTEVNFTGNTTHDYAYYKAVSYAGFANLNSTLSERLSNNVGFEFKNILRYTKSFGDHSINAMAAHESRGGRSLGIGGNGGGFFNDNMNSLSLSDIRYAQPNGTRGKYKSESYLSRIFYNYKDLFMATTSLRADGSPNFPTGNRWGYFPSFSGAVKLSNFPFLKDKIQGLDKLKINGGWGQVGNDNTLGGLYRPLVRINPISDATNGGFSSTMLNYDENLHWETTTSTNLGLEAGFLQGRINLQVELYSKKTTDAFNQLMLPSSVGSGIYIVSNIASTGNKGLEITINTVNTKGAFKWDTDFTFTMNRNEILDLGTNGLALYGGGFFPVPQFSKSVVGGPIGRFWGYQADGLYQNFDEIALSSRYNGMSTIDQLTGLWLGDVKFTNVDNVSGVADWVISGYKGQTDASGNYIAGTAQFTGNADDKITVKNAQVIDEKDQTFIGDPNPKFTFGFNNSFSYKNFDLNIYLVGVYGNKIYNAAKQAMMNGTYNWNSLSIMKDRAVPVMNSGGNSQNIFDYTLQNANSEVPRLRSGATLASSSVNSRFVEDGSYLRFQNVVLGYNVPKNLASKLKMNKLRVYLNAQNLFTLTKYSGWDPEVGTYDQRSTSAGYDSGRYPVSRVIMMGVQVGF